MKLSLGVEHWLVGHLLIANADDMTLFAFHVTDCLLCLVCKQFIGFVWFVFYSDAKAAKEMTVPPEIVATVEEFTYVLLHYFSFYFLNWPVPKIHFFWLRAIFLSCINFRKIDFNSEVLTCIFSASFSGKSCSYLHISYLMLTCPIIQHKIP